jgi:hypothetical protein
MSYTPRRKFDKYWQAHIKKLATTVGEVVLAMNLLQAMLFAVFWKLLDLTPNEEREPFEVRLYVTIDQAQNIWNAIASDATQRELMLAAAEGLIPPGTNQNPAFLKRIKWLKLKADSLGRIRNDAAHLVVEFDHPENRLVPAQFAMPAPRKKIARAETH